MKQRNAAPPVRQRLPPGNLSTLIVGLDGIGRLVARQLAAIGIQRLLLLDSMRVSRSRQAAHGYAPEDIGRPRAHAAAQCCHAINPTMHVHAATSVARLRDESDDPIDAIICCPSGRPQWPAALKRVTDGTIVVTCAAQKRTVRIEYLRVNAAFRASLKRIRRSSARIAIPVHTMTIAAGLLVAELMHLAAGSTRWRTLACEGRRSAAADRVTIVVGPRTPGLSVRRHGKTGSGGRARRVFSGS